MTALTANTALQFRNREGQKWGNALVATSTTIYHNSLIMKNGLGFLLPCAINTTSTFAGIAHIDNPTVASGIIGDGSTVYLDYFWGVDALLPAVTAVTTGEVGLAAYCGDDNTVASSATTSKGPQIGLLEEVPAALTAWVAIRSGAMAKGTTS
jgi:hypothetical protein